jgi:hypothetical protein
MRLPVVPALAPCLLALSILVPSTTARAATVSVGCPGATGGPYDHASLTAALVALDPNIPNTINVEGDCHNEAVQLFGFRSLTIQGPTGGTATISHDQGTCGTPASGFAGRPVLLATDSHQLQLRRLILTGGAGVSLDDSSGGMQAVTVENSIGNGINLNNASNLGFQGVSGGPTPNVIQNNCGTGLTVSPGSSAGMNNSNTIQNNGGQGVFVSGNLNLNGGPDASNQILIQNNTRQGIVAGQRAAQVSAGGHVVIQNNALANEPEFVFRAGVFGNGTIAINSGPTSAIRIVNNGGPGIWMDLGGVARLGNPTPGVVADITVNGNTNEGLKLTHMSTGWTLPGTMISGNGSSDATCDKTSLLFGDVSGIGKIKCSNVEKDK